MSIGLKLRFLMIFLVLTIISSSLISFWSTNLFEKKIHDLVEVQLPGVSNMILADMMHDGIRANVYRAILVSNSKNPEEVKEVKDEAIEFADNMRNYIKELQALDLLPETKKAIAPALPRIEEYVNSAQEIVTIAFSEGEEKAKAALPKFNEKFDALETELGTLGDLIRLDSTNSGIESKSIEANAFKLNVISLVIGLILLSFFGFVVKDQQGQLEKIINNLEGEVGRIGDTASSLNTSAKNLADSTNLQSSAFQESASALEQISATVSTTENNSKELDSNSKISLEKASSGKVIIQDMLVAMDVINTSNSEITKQIEEGNEKISDIVKLIGDIENKTKVINDIVFQTKLLSFNASVEAARAGEQGKGFAVVAEEVGNLATMSGSAAKEISDMLTSSMTTVEKIVNESRHKVEVLATDGKQKVKQGIDIAKKCGSSLDAIVEQASNVEKLITEISRAVQEQAIGINEVSKAMGQLDEASNQNSITSKETLSSSDNLRDQVEKLEDIINSLSMMMTRKKRV